MAQLLWVPLLFFQYMLLQSVAITNAGNFWPVLNNPLTSNEGVFLVS